jgi:PP-loop superfamily ATP-utilizing enzyme
MHGIEDRIRRANHKGETQDDRGCGRVYEIARIEVSRLEMGRLFELKENVVRGLKDIGFNYVTLDLEGYRSGSMDAL